MIIKGMTTIMMMKITNNVPLACSILILAGIWQFTPWKNACLKHCNSPIQFLSQRWKNGPLAALKIGLEHGAYCIGCCWFLMALLFYGGVMNLIWIIGLAVLVLAEKVIPAGLAFGRVAGLLLIAWGIWLVFTA